MYLFLFCMHLQTTAVGKNALKKKFTTIPTCSNSKSSMCVEVKIVCPQTGNKSVNDDCKFTLKDFTMKFESLLQNNTGKTFKCQNMAMKCKGRYFVYCYEQLFVLISTKTPKNN